MNKKLFFFDHIYKAAGTSIDHICRQALGADNVSPGLIEGADSALANYRDYQLITGHFWFPPGMSLPTDRYCFTILRHPIDRVLSHYFFSRNNVQGISNQETELAKTLSLHDYVFCDPSVLSIISNNQTNHFFHLAWDGNRQLDHTEKLELAKRSLEQYQLVGVVEHLADFIDMLCYECNWPPIGVAPRLNATRARPAIEKMDQTVIARLEEINQSDIALYEYAIELFNRRKHLIWIECIQRKSAVVGALHPSTGYQQNLQIIDSTLKPIDYGNRQIEILAANVRGAITMSSVLYSGETIRIQVRLRAHIDTEDLTVGIHIHDPLGRLMFGINTFNLGYKLAVAVNNDYFVNFICRNDLGLGRYTLGVTLHTGSAHTECCYHRRDHMESFEVANNIGQPFNGRVKLYPQVSWGVLAENRTITLPSDKYREMQVQRVAWHTPALTEFSAEIKVLGQVDQLSTNEIIVMDTLVTNTSKQNWPCSGHRPVVLCYHWLDARGAMLVYEGERTFLPRDIAPGEQVRLSVIIKSPDQAGETILQLTMLQEFVSWFDQSGVPPVETKVKVINPMRQSETAPTPS